MSGRTWWLDWWTADEESCRLQGSLVGDWLTESPTRRRKCRLRETRRGKLHETTRNETAAKGNDAWGVWETVIGLRRQCHRMEHYW